MVEEKERMKLYEVSVYGFVSSKIRAEIEREVKESSLRFMSWPMEKRIIIMVDRHTEGVKEAIAAAKAYAPFVRKIEVETENLDMVKEAVEAGADIVMLDNMSVEDMKAAVCFINGRAEIECSGNVTKENVAKLIDIGVDYISSGALTHSSPILDLSLKNLHAI